MEDARKFLQFELPWLIEFISVFSAGLLFIVCFSGLTRWALQRRAAQSYRAFVVGITGATILPVLFVVGPLMLVGGSSAFAYLAIQTPERPIPMRADVFLRLLPVYALGSANLVLALPGAMFSGLAVLMLVHRLCWPMVNRPIYALARHGIFRNRKLLIAIGISLWILAISPVGRWGSMIAKKVGLE